MINIRIVGQKQYLDSWDIVFRKIGIFGRFFPIKNENGEIENFALYLKVGDYFLDHHAIFNLDTGEIFSSPLMEGFKCDS